MRWNNLVLMIMLLMIDSICAQDSKELVAAQIDHWHKAAAAADYDTYFDLMTAPGVFVGTAATEHWNLETFKAFSKPYFDSGKAWSFKSIERHIYFTEDKQTAFFDELLTTPMGICRGSGVVTLTDGIWKIAHYVLSITVPNDEVDQLKKRKKENDSLLVQKLLKH